MNKEKEAGWRDDFEEFFKEKFHDRITDFVWVSDSCVWARNSSSGDSYQAQTEWGYYREGRRQETAAQNAKGDPVAWRWTDNEGFGGSPLVHYSDCPPGRTTDAVPLYANPPNFDQNAKDAERYRWLRLCDCSMIPTNSKGLLLAGTSMDVAIDAAIAGERK